MRSTRRRRRRGAARRPREQDVLDHVGREAVARPSRRAGDTSATAIAASPAAKQATCAAPDRVRPGSRGGPQRRHSRRRSRRRATEDRAAGRGQATGPDEQDVRCPRARIRTRLNAARRRCRAGRGSGIARTSRSSPEPLPVPVHEEREGQRSRGRSSAPTTVPRCSGQVATPDRQAVDVPIRPRPVEPRTPPRRPGAPSTRRPGTADGGPADQRDRAARRFVVGPEFIAGAPRGTATTNTKIQTTSTKCQ